MKHNNKRVEKSIFKQVVISKVFLDQYGTIPSEIIAIDIMNIHHAEESTEQVSYFDSIKFSNIFKEKDDLFRYITASSFVSLEVIVFLLILRYSVMYVAFFVIQSPYLIGITPFQPLLATIFAVVHLKSTIRQYAIMQITNMFFLLNGAAQLPCL